MGVGRIPWTAVHEYAKAEGIENEWRFRRLIRELDDAYVTAVSERTAQQDKKDKKKVGNSNTKGGQQ